MPNKHAAEKDLRKNERRAKRNLRLKSYVKLLGKQAQEFLKGGKIAEAKTTSAKLQQAADKAAKHHIFSRKAAGRRKGLLMRALHAQK